MLRCAPGSTAAERAGLVERGSVQLGGRRARRLSSRVAPGQLVALSEPFGFGSESEGEDTAAGPWQVLAPAPAWRSGVLARRKGMRSAVGFEKLEERRGVALLELVARPDPAGRRGALGDEPGLAPDLLRALADAGHPVLGGVLRGGVLVEGGLRLAPAGAPPAWPEEPVFPGDDGTLPSLRVSRATARIVGRGHSWILRDADTDDAAGFAPGTRVRVCGPDDRDLGAACVEGSGHLTARMWSPPGRGGRTDPGRSVEQRVADAMRRRRPLFESGGGQSETDVFRLVHGEADGLPGLFVDRLGGLLRVLIASPATAAFRGRALDALVRGFEKRTGEEAAVVEVVHLRDRPPGELRCVTLLRGDPDRVTRRLPVREHGIHFRVDPGLDEPLRSRPGFGLYPDQRDNRARICEGANRKGRLLNLFAHTGSFSVAWLAAGGGAAVSVDLSRPYLGWLEENLAANPIDPGRHECVRQDGRRYLEALSRGERFDAIVIDPPTAASGGRRFWSVGRDLTPLVALALERLEGGGRLLVSRNDRRSGRLAEGVEEAAQLAGVRLSSVDPAPPGIDHPRLQGFPEGDPFRAVMATRA